MRLYLGGGGSAQDEAELFRAWVRPGIRCVYWPFALERRGYDEGARWYGAALGPGVRLETWRDLGARSPADLLGVDVVLVGGGNTYALLDHVRSTGWAEPIRSWVREGGTYVGDSAGAVLAGADIDLARFADPNDVGIVDTSGLSLLPGVLLRPHYRPADLDELRGWARRTGCAVVGLPERGGAAVEDAVLRNPGPDDVVIVTAEGEAVLRAGESAPVAALLP